MPDTTDPLLPLFYDTAVVAERTGYIIVLPFRVQVCFVHTRLPKYQLFLILDALVCLGYRFPVIDLEDKRSAVPALFAEINLAHIAPGYGEDIVALTDRTVNHGQQLYMSIRYKN
jgi:hypothetical protein